MHTQKTRTRKKIENCRAERTVREREAGSQRVNSNCVSQLNFVYKMILIIFGLFIRAFCLFRELTNGKLFQVLESISNRGRK